MKNAAGFYRDAFHQGELLFNFPIYGIGATDTAIGAERHYARFLKENGLLMRDKEKRDVMRQGHQEFPRLLWRGSSLEKYHQYAFSQPAFAYDEKNRTLDLVFPAGDDYAVHTMDVSLACDLLCREREVTRSEFVRPQQYQRYGVVVDGVPPEMTMKRHVDTLRNCHRLSNLTGWTLPFPCDEHFLEAFHKETRRHEEYLGNAQDLMANDILSTPGKMQAFFRSVDRHYCTLQS